MGKNGQLLGFSYLNLNEGIGKHFAESLRQEYIDLNIEWREIQNVDQVEAVEDFTDLAEKYQQVYSSRALPKSLLSIRHNTMIYGQVMSFFHHYQNEMFGIEIHNSAIAQSQKQIFEILWQMAKPIEEILDEKV